MSEYQERDIIEQGEYYAKHVNAMTAEGLHDKSAIAAELAERDIEIAGLTFANDVLTQENIAYQQQLRDKEARIARLEEAMQAAIAPDMWIECVDGTYEYRYADWYGDWLEETLKESPQQSLAYIQANAVEEAKQSFVHFCHVDDIPENKMDAFDYGLYAYEKHLDKYAANLRA